MLGVHLDDLLSLFPDSMAFFGSVLDEGDTVSDTLLAEFQGLPEAELEELDEDEVVLVLEGLVDEGLVGSVEVVEEFLLVELHVG